MFHSKQDVDRHVVEVFKHIGSEHQRNLKCYQIAKSYYKFKDYKSAIKYINRFILTTANSAPAYRLLGECYLGINSKVKALHAFKTSLEFNGSQHDLVLKICTLLMDPEVFAVTPRANYWLDRAEALFPTNQVVFQLREYILKSNLGGKQDNGQLEKLIISEVNARPTDVTVRIRLLNLFLDSKRFKIAYQHALDIEERNIFSEYPIWYDCLCKVVEAYEKANAGPLGFEFLIKKLFFLERRADLYLQEYKDEVKSLPECSQALLVFDQSLYAFSKIEAPQEDAYFFKEVLRHLGCQLSFHLATFALKRAKKEYGTWPKAVSIATPLLLQASQTSMDLNDAWYNMWSGKDKRDTEAKHWSKMAASRVSQIGHILNAWSQNKKSKFLEKASMCCTGKWQTQIYKNIFYNKEQDTDNSYFVNEPLMSILPKRLLTDTELKAAGEVAQSTHPDSLHHLVWLGAANCDSNGQLDADFRCMTVPKLQFTVDNLSQTGPETLNQLDVDAFLYTSVLCGKSATTRLVNNDRPTLLPVSISEELCTSAQAEWWVAVHKTYNNQSGDSIGEMRLRLRRGIEVVRAVGHHGLDVKILVMLAKLFQKRATGSKNATETNGLEERAHWYWTAAIPMLEKVEKNHRLRVVPDRLFHYKGNELTASEIKKHLEDGRLFLACRLMKQGQNDEAIEAFQSLKSPYATYYQGLIYEKLASEEVNHLPESITSENRSQHITLLTRAREAFYLTLDRLRSPNVDLDHPLNSELQDHLEDIEKQLAMIDSDNSLNRNGDSESDETDPVPHPLSPDTDDNVGRNLNVFNTSNSFFSVKNARTPRTVRQNLTDKRPLRLEARPSPERLDAQLRYLVQANTSGLQTVVEQLKELKSIIQIELKDLGCVTRDLLAEMKRYNDKVETTCRREIESLKPEELFNLGEEDYEELNQLSQSYPPYQNYMLNRPMPGAQVTPTAPYGTSVPSPGSSLIPPVENSLLPPSFYPGHQMDPSVLMYQGLRYYQGLPFGDSQNLPDYRGPGVQKDLRKQKGVLKGNYKTPENASVVCPTSTPATASGTFIGKGQPPNVVITSSDVLPVFTSSGTPAMSVTIPPQHIRCSTPSSTPQKFSSAQTHPFQIHMPPQAHFVNESPTGKLNSLVPTTSASSSPAQKSNTSLDKNQSPKFTAPFSTTAQGNGSPSVQTKPTEKPVVNAQPKLEKTPATVESKPEVEVKLFESDAQVFIQESKEWKDKGRFKIKIEHDKEKKKVKILLLQGPSNLFAAYVITANTTLDTLKNNDSGWVLSVNNFPLSNSKLKETQMEKTVWPKTCLIFDNKTGAKNFENAYNNSLQILNISNKPKSGLFITPTKQCPNCKKLFDGYMDKCDKADCNSQTAPPEKTNLGGFTFLSSPIVQPPPPSKPEEKEKPNEPAKAVPFASFSFSSPKQTNLFAALEKDPNAFKKDANFKGFEGHNSLVFGNLKKPVKAIKDPDTTADDEGDEFVPTAEFTPVVDLPDLVDVKTGEENDDVLFDERAKLLRFATSTKEWKERGIGNIKLLLNKESQRVRLIMRREVVLKVCCNHYLDEKMEFVPMTKSDRAVSWYAQDYSEGDLKPELFALKFKSPEKANEFLEVVKKTQAKIKNGRVGGDESSKQLEKPAEKPADSKPLSEIFKPKVGSWECEKCLVRNDGNSEKCACCETPKPGTTVDTKEQSKPKQLGKGIIFPPTTMTFTFGIPPQSTQSTQSTAVTTMTTTTSSTTSGPTEFTFGIPTPKVTTVSTSVTAPTNKFVFGLPSTSASTVSFGTPQANVTTTTMSSMPSFSFGVTPGSVTSSTADTTITTTTSALSNFKFGTQTQGKESTTAPLFQSSLFGSGANSTITKNVTNIFGGSSLGKPDEKSSLLSLSNNSKTEPKSGTTQPTYSFGQSLKLHEKDKFEFSFNKVKPEGKSDVEKTPRADTSGEQGNSDESDGEVEDNGDNITFESVVPLPEKVDLPTGEEDEDVKYEQRAKLFRFFNKEWKERGIGDVKILKHKTNSKIRLLMRRETVLKVCLNHYVTSDIVFNRKDEKTWQWCAPDYSEGEVQYDTFAIRFKTPEIAQGFMDALEAVKKNLEPSVKKPESEARAATTRTSDQDISIVYENQVSPELREKAEALGLPPNFYSYLQAPGCPGCSGCDKDDEAILDVQQKAADSTTQPIFGTIPSFKAWSAFNSASGDGTKKCVFSFSGNKDTTNKFPAVSSVKAVFSTAQENDDCDREDEEETGSEYDEGEIVEYEDYDECEEEEYDDEDEENEDDEDDG
ncbi:hypothetical protein RUM43_004091 [Polyplax serrata]|uniref:Nuclear pore complex protein Nup153 n=1 Tax=Polyplax serrata TaxID=468196 RepID=A0AAN8SB32_POLSC